MRKLMIAAAAAALTAGAFAENDPQVYEMTLTVKTTACNTKHKSIANPCVEGETIIYRQQVTRKYQGLFWGCECQVIACPDGYFAGVESQDNRYLFWSATKGFQFRLEGDDEAFKWDLLQVVGPKSANVEGAWTLVLKNTDGKEVLNVAGAGYGSAKNVCSANAQIKSMSGYVTGINDIDNEGAIYGCYYCGDEIDCEAVQFCPACTDGFDSAKTAVFGSWTLKFNSSAANKLAKGNGTTIDKAYKFPKYVNLDANTEGEGEGTGTETSAIKKLESEYAKAKEAYEKAKATFDELDKGMEKCSQYKTLQNEVTQKTKAVTVANAEKTVADTQKTAADAVLTQANKDLGAATALKDDTEAINDLIAARANLQTAKDNVTKAQNAYDDEKDPAKRPDLKKKITEAEGVVTEAETVLSKVEERISKSTDTAGKEALDKLLQAVKDAEADVATAEAEVKDAEAAVKKAGEDKTAAEKAVTTWKTGDDKTDGSYKKAVADAEDAMKEAESKKNMLQSACLGAKGDCY